MSAITSLSYFSVKIVNFGQSDLLIQIKSRTFLNYADLNQISLIILQMKTKFLKLIANY